MGALESVGVPELDGGVSGSGNDLFVVELDTVDTVLMAKEDTFMWAGLPATVELETVLAELFPVE